MWLLFHLACFLVVGEFVRRARRTAWLGPALAGSALLQLGRLATFDSAVTLDSVEWVVWSLPVAGLLAWRVWQSPRGSLPAPAAAVPWLGLAGALLTGMFLVRDINMTESAHSPRSSATIFGGRSTTTGRRGSRRMHCEGVVMSFEGGRERRWDVSLPCRLVILRKPVVLHEGVLGIAWLEPR